MEGQVKNINNHNGWVAVLLENGEYSIFEALGGYDIEVGDIISGEIDFDGGAIAYNRTKDEHMDIITEFTGLSPNQIKEKLYL